MDIEGFYDADPRRRHSEEFSFGRDWHDADGVRWELNWVADTGEVYVMREPAEPVGMDPLGDTWVADLPADLVTVEVLGTITGQATVERAFGGWPEAIEGADSLAWVRDRVTRAEAGDLPVAAGDAASSSLDGDDPDDAPAP